MRWASAEGVSQNVIAAVLLFHYHSVEEIVPKLSPAELDKVLVLVGRNPRLYPPGTMEALERRRKLAASVPWLVARRRPRDRVQHLGAAHIRPDGMLPG